MDLTTKNGRGEKKIDGDEKKRLTSTVDANGLRSGKMKNTTTEFNVVLELVAIIHWICYI